jgi:DNA polymerase I-like protein with 3'-5' exonuclease and polymerase domains
MVYNIEKSMDKACEYRYKIEELDKKLGECVDGKINWGSPKQVATILYGGELEVETVEEYLFYYKDARKPPKTKTRRVKGTITYPQMVRPIKDSAGQDSFSTDEGTLRQIRAGGKAGRILALLKERSKLAKLVGTYLMGLPKVNFSNEWESNILHGKLNQVKAITGRLSSSKPNMQNMPPECTEFFGSRYG